MRWRFWAVCRTATYCTKHLFATYCAHRDL
jgi:hypothetical protein